MSEPESMTHDVAIHDPIAVGKHYCLRLPDGRILGHIQIDKIEDCWAVGPFTPTPLFEDYRERFEREVKLRHDQILPLWERAADDIEALQLQVIEAGKETIRQWPIVYVEGNHAILGLEPSSMI